MNSPSPLYRAAIRGLLAAALAACLAPASAEKADRNKPINVEADRMSYDDLKQINVFTGNVTLTKGSIIIKGDRLVIRQDLEGFQYATANGSVSAPAWFRQKRDLPDQFMEGQALQLDYDSKTEVVKLQQRALLKRLEKDRVTDEVHGNLIVYESLNEFFTVESAPGATPTVGNPGGRVRVVIQPKTTLAPGSPAAAAAAATDTGPLPGLKPDASLGASTPAAPASR